MRVAALLLKMRCHADAAYLLIFRHFDYRLCRFADIPSLFDDFATLRYLMQRAFRAMLDFSMLILMLPPRHAPILMPLRFDEILLSFFQLRRATLARAAALDAASPCCRDISRDVLPPLMLDVAIIDAPLLIISAILYVVYLLPMLRRHLPLRRYAMPRIDFAMLDMASRAC